MGGYRYFPGKVLHLDPAGRIWEASEDWGQWLGYDPEGVKGRDWIAFVAGSDRDRAIALLLNPSQTATPPELPLNFVAQDGTFCSGRISVRGQPPAAGAGYLMLITENPAEAIADQPSPVQSAPQAFGSEQRLRFILEHMPILLDAFDEDMNLVVWNQECERVTGYSAQEMIGNPRAMEILYPEPVYRQALIDQWLSGTYDRRHWECDLTCRDGTVKTIAWANISTEFPIPGWSTWGVGKDVSDLKRAEAQFQQQQELLQTVIDTDPTLIFVKDQEGRYLLANRAFTDLYRTTLAAIQGKTDEDLHPFPEETAQFQRENQQVLATGQSLWIREQRFSQVNAEPLWFQWHKYPIQLPGQDDLCVLGVGVNITERKRTEQALRESQAMNQAIQNALPDLIVCMDMDGQYLGVKPPTTFPLLKPELMKPGVNVRDILTTTDAEQRLQAAQRAIQSGQIQVYEFPLQIQETTHWQEVRVVPVQDPAFQNQVLVVIRDITDRKAAELALQEWNAQLEQRVQERTAQLEHSNRELESFSYSVSHDLRAPLRHIKGFAEMLQYHLQAIEQLDPKTSHYLEIIQNSTLRMGKLIDGLLTLSRVGRRELNRQVVDLKPLVERAIALLNYPTVCSATGQPATKNHADENQTSERRDPKTASANLPIHFMVADLPTVEGDPTLLQQVFSNLIDNAVKFSRDRSTRPDHSPAQVEIGALPDQTVFVRDNGIGFSMENADRIFSPFQQLHPANLFGGMGIGLAVVQRIIHRHGGTLWVESQPNKGTTFFFRL